MDEQTCERHWRRQASFWSARINLGWWLSHVWPTWMGLNVLACGVALAGWTELLGGQSFWLGYALVWSVLAWWALRRARAHFCDLPTALWKLETRLGLNQQLSLAQAGETPWPAVSSAPWPFRWNWWREMGPLVLSALLLAICVWWPHRSSGTTDGLENSLASPPATWAEIEELIELAERADVFDDESIDRFREQFDSLREQPEESWFDQDTLEATDALEADMRQSLGEQSQNLETASSLLNMVPQMEDASEARQQLFDEAMDEVMQDLSFGTTPLDPSLAEQLRQSNPGFQPDNDGLSEEQRKKLQERLQNGAKTLADSPQLQNQKGQMPLDLLPSPGQIGEAGEPERGPGTAPMLILENENLPPPATVESLSAEMDDERAILGDTVGVEVLPGSTRPEFQGPTQGFAADRYEDAAEAANRQSLTPEEQSVLKRFFE